MKKLVIAAAVLGAFAGAAQAQTSVTLFGVVDTDFVHLNATGAGSKTFEDNSGINSSRIGFRGTEDLGGGLKAGFWLEAGTLATNDGASGTTSVDNQGTSSGGGGLVFARRSTVSLIGDAWGEVRLGRDYVPTFWNAANTDPFGYNGLANIGTLLAVTDGAMGPAAVRASNGVSYLTPNTLGGFFVQVTYALGNNADPTYSTNGTISGKVSACPAAPANCYDINDNGDYLGANFGYQNGPIYAGLATSETKFQQTAEGGNIKTTNLGVSYDLAFVKPDIFYQTSKIDANTPVRTDIWQLGASVPFGQSIVNLTFGRATGKDGWSGNSANMWGVGYVYNLSKRTALYGQWARIHDSGNVFNYGLNDYSYVPITGADTTNTSGSENGIAIGIRHSF